MGVDWMKKGFTLIELLVVLGIIAIVLSIGVLKLGFVTSFHEQTEYRMVAQDLKYARNLAMVKRKGVNFVFDADRKGYSILIAGEIRPKLDKEVALIHLQIENKNFDLATVTFTSGGAPSKGGTFYLKGQGHRYEITVEPATGKVNMKGIPE